MSVLPQRHDVLPVRRSRRSAAARPARSPRRARPRTPGGAGGRSATERQNSKSSIDDEVLEADPVRAARHEVAVVGEALAAEDGRVAGVQLVGRRGRAAARSSARGSSRSRPCSPWRSKAIWLSGPMQRPAGLERAARPVLEHAQHPGVVLVGHLADRVAGRARGRSASGAGHRQRALADERLRRCPPRARSARPACARGRPSGSSGPSSRRARPRRRGSATTAGRAGRCRTSRRSARGSGARGRRGRRRPAARRSARAAPSGSCSPRR